MRHRKRQVRATITIFDTDQNPIHSPEAFIQSRIINYAWVSDALRGTGIQPSDGDGLIHIEVEQPVNKYQTATVDKFLLLEYKTKGVKMNNANNKLSGQARMLNAVANQKDWEVILIEHEARDVDKKPVVSTWFYGRGKKEFFFGEDNLRQAITDWAKKHGRIKKYE